MPLLKPKNDESHDDFVSRCMANETMQAEYPDEDQRYAVCESQWSKKSMTAPLIERRNFAIESLVFEEREDSRRHLVGHAAVFDAEFDTGWMIESIERGAFKKSIKRDDIRALWNHNPDYVLGRNKAGTLSLKEDDKGLLVDILPPDTQWARDLTVSIERGDVSQMSFGFEPETVEWIYSKDEKEPDRRILRQVHLWDVSPVTFPAYEDTDIAMRSHEAWRKTIPPETPEMPEGPSLPWKSHIYQRKIHLLKLGGISNG